MADDLEARLESHHQAFEGLLSLIPAKDYYGVDNSDQWTRKKQSKEQKRAAKKAKLNPANQKTAKDVMDENERKRKRELGMNDDQEEDDASDVDNDAEQEAPGEGPRKNKKQKVEDDDAKRALRAEKRKEKRQSKKEKLDKVKQKKEAKKSQKQDQDLDELAADSTTKADADGDDSGDDDMDVTADVMDFSGLNDDSHISDASSAPSNPDQDSVFDASANQSAASSSSSIVPPAEVPAPTASDSKDATSKPKKEKALKLPEVDAEELQSRLRARIEELRARRKADGPNGQPAKSRQDLLETRRKKEEARKAHKKELRLKAKQDEERQNNERLRGSGSPLSTDIFSPRVEQNNFSFGRVAFEDGQEADASLSTIGEHKKRKGPSDTRAALLAAEKKAARLAGYDDDKRADIEEKDLWLNAKKKAHGERLKDDQNLLKKALKRKEKVKTKSATEWNERKDNVVKGKEMKQKKRDTNLAKRREEKGSKKGGKKGGAKKGGKARPGFEGRFKA